MRGNLRRPRMRRRRRFFCGEQKETVPPFPTSEFGHPEDVFDLICETYQDVSGLFKETEECVREYIGAYIADVRAGIDVPNEFGIDINHPFHGLFQRETEYSRAVTPQIRQAGNRLSGLAETAYASLLA